VYEFKSTSADALNSTNTALGAVIMSTEYDLAKSPFTTKMQMENYEFTSSCKPSCSMLHPIECDPAQTPIPTQYVRNSNSTVYDKRLTDLGLFQIATYGMQAAAVIGELWVTYEIELLKPRVNLVYAGANHIVNNYGASSVGGGLINVGTLISTSGDSLFRSLFTFNAVSGTVSWANAPELVGRSLRLLVTFPGNNGVAVQPVFVAYAIGASSTGGVFNAPASSTLPFDTYVEATITAASGSLGLTTSSGSVACPQVLFDLSIIA